MALLFFQKTIFTPLYGLNFPDLQERVILYGRYVNFYSWEKIAQDMGYSERHVLRLHGSALEKVQIP